MSNSSNNDVWTDVPDKDKISIQSLLADTYTGTKKQLQQRITVFKEEFTGTRDIFLSLPVNNFLKDLSQIEKEFEFECKKEMMPLVNPARSCNFVPIDQILPGEMEENY